MLEESLTLRSFERTIEEVLLDGGRRPRRRRAHDRRVRVRLAPRDRMAVGAQATRAAGEPALRASSSSTPPIPCDLDGLHAQALELRAAPRRAAHAVSDLGDRADAARPRAARARARSAVVLTGRRVTLDSIGRLVYAVRGDRPRRDRVRLPQRGAGHGRQHRLPARRGADRARGTGCSSGSTAHRVHRRRRRGHRSTPRTRWRLHQRTKRPPTDGRAAGDSYNRAPMPPPHRPVDPRASFPELEERVLARWRERDVFHESIRRRQGAPNGGSTRARRPRTDRPAPTTCSRACSRTSSPATRRCAATTSSARAGGTATDSRSSWRSRPSSASPRSRTSSATASPSSTRAAARASSATSRTGTG